MLREDSDGSALRTGPRYRPWSRYRSARSTSSHGLMLPLEPATPCAIRLPPRRSLGLGHGVPQPRPHGTPHRRLSGSQAIRPAGHPSPCGACNRCASPSQRRAGFGRAAGRDHWSGDPVTRVEFSPSHRAGQPDASRCDRGPRSGNPTAQSASAAHLRAVRADIAPRRTDIRGVPARLRTTAPGLSRAPEMAASKPSGVPAHRPSEGSSPLSAPDRPTGPRPRARGNVSRVPFPSGVTRKPPPAPETVRQV